jgi:hypothetical protein
MPDTTLIVLFRSPATSIHHTLTMKVPMLTKNIVIRTSALPGYFILSQQHGILQNAEFESTTIPFWGAETLFEWFSMFPFQLSCLVLSCLVYLVFVCYFCFRMIIPFSLNVLLLPFSSISV